MEISFRRVLGLYFLVTSLQFLPAAVFMLGVINGTGPNWILPATSFTQGVITALAGLVLFRSRARINDVPGTLVTPSLPVLLELIGVYFIVSGLVHGVGPLFRLMFLNEVLARSVGSELAAAGVGILTGGLLIARARPIANALDR